MLTRDPGPTKLARATDAGKAVKPQNAENPLPKEDEQTNKELAPHPASSPAAVQPRTQQVEPKSAEQSKPVASESPAAVQTQPSSTDAPKALKPEPKEPPRKASQPPKKKSKTHNGVKDPSGTANDDVVAISVGEVRKWLPITLPSPSRAAVTEAMLSVPKNWQHSLFPDPKNVFPWEVNGKLLGVFTLAGVNLNGAAATLHPNGHLHTLVTYYSKGFLEGCVKLWDQDGVQVLYADYQHGKKHGVLCFFQNGRPWLIQACDRGKPQDEYLVKWTQDGPRVLSTEQLTGPEVDTAKQQLADLEDAMRKSETKLKNKLKTLVAGSASKKKRDDMLRHIAGHNAAKTAESNAFWQSALKRSGF